jgi:hypothetical protein
VLIGILSRGGCRNVLRGQNHLEQRPWTHRNNIHRPPAPPPKKSCLDKTRNCLARTVAQIRCGHWRSAVYLKRIRRRSTDHCWFCNNKNRKMTRSHTLLHCSNERLVAARQQAWGNVTPSGIKALLANPRWESRLLHFLDLSGVGRIVEDGSCEDEAWGVRMDNWVARRSREPD